MPRPIVGGIRWPAFYFNGGAAVSNMRTLMGQADYQYLIPWYINDLPTEVGTQSSMDAELIQSKANGYDYFIYDFWFRNYFNAANGGLDKHRSSAFANRVKYCITHLPNYTPATWDADIAADIVPLMMESNYQRMGNKPIYCLFNAPTFVTQMASYAGGGAGAIAALNAAVIAAGATDGIYTITAGTSVSGDHTAAVTLGLDALASYNSVIYSADSNNLISQAAFETASIANWTTQVGYGDKSVIPHAGLGWNIQGWLAAGIGCTNPPDGWACHDTDHTPEATPAEAAGRMQAAITFAAANPTLCNTGHIWFGPCDEYTEDGGGAFPTRGNKGYRMQALAHLLQKQGECRQVIRGRGVQQWNSR